MGRFQPVGQRSFFPWERRGGFFRRTGSKRLGPVLGVCAVVVLLGVVALRERRQAGIRRTRAVLLDVRRAVDLYMASSRGQCPDGFESLVERGLLSQIPKDAWDNPLTLICPRQNAAANYRLVSAGPDGVAEGLDRIE